MEKTGSKETTALFIILILSRICLGGINGFVDNSAAGAGVSVIICTVLALSVCFFSGKPFEKESYGSVFKKAYGRSFGTVILVLMFIITIINASYGVRNFTDAVGRYILPETPDVIIAAVFSACIFWVSRFGIESVTRYSMAVFLVFLVFLGIILFSSHTEAHTDNIIPFTGKGGLGNVFNMLYVFSDIVYVFLIIRGINKNGSKTPFYALAIGGVISAVLVLFYTLCVPYPVSERFEYPLYRLASLANTTVVFQRLDGIVYIIWMFSGFISIGTLGLFSIYVFDECFKLYDKKAIAPIISFLVFLLSGINIIDKASALMSVFTFAVFPFSVMIYKVRSKK